MLRSMQNSVTEFEQITIVLWYTIQHKIEAIAALYHNWVSEIWTNYYFTIDITYICKTNHKSCCVQCKTT